LGFLPGTVETFYEPFAGSAAVSLAAARASLARNFVISDSLKPLIGIWDAILHSPEDLANSYERIWAGSADPRDSHFTEIRAEYNRSGDPAKLLYLLARCVKNAVRFNRLGEFNQSPDRRRRGMSPDKMRWNLFGAHHLLAGHTVARSVDYAEVLASAGTKDFVYMDPPYQGTSQTRDRRYIEALDVDKFVNQLDQLNSRGVRFIVSFDGKCGEKSYGPELPAFLKLRRYELEVGRSTQATLNGRNEVTTESLYVSPTISSTAPFALSLKRVQIDMLDPRAVGKAAAAGV
jgi:DNA adenine methylase